MERLTMESSHRTYRRSDGILGVGFVIAICGTEQASIAWPDRPAERYIVEDMARNGVEEIVPIESVGSYVPEGLTAEKLLEELNEMEALGIKPSDLDGLTIATDGTITAAPGTEIVPDGEGGAVVVDLPDVGLLPDGSPAIVSEPELNAFTEAQAIRNYLADHGSGVTNKEVIAALKEMGVKVESSQVTTIKKEMASAQSIAS